MTIETKMAISAKTATQDNLTTTLNTNSTRFTAPLPNLPITYSRGESQYDNQPDQRIANSWEDLWEAFSNDRGSAKGQQYVCGSMGMGKHTDKNKYPHEAHYRRRDGAENCLFLPFDCDHIPKNMFEMLLALLDEYEGCSYTTSSHTPDNPRARLFVALSRPVTREERIRLGKAYERFVESRGVVGVQFDASVYQTEQMCYLPLINADFKHHEGGLALDVDALLGSEFGSGHRVSDSNSGLSSSTATTTRGTHHPKLTYEQLEIVLFHIDPDDEQAWSDTVNGLARDYGEDGREYFHLYSRRSSKYKYDECDERYDRALRELVNRPEGYGTKHLVKLASTHPDWPKVEHKFLHWGETLPIEQLFGGVEGISVPEQLELEPIEQVNQKFAWDSRNLLLYSRQSRMYVTESSFKTNYLNQQVMVGARSQPLGNAWLTSSKRLEVNGLRMAPNEGAITKSGELNTWLGYSVSPIEGDIDAFLCAFAYLFPNAGDKDFILAFIAKMIQCPETRFNVALGVYGEVEGTGKNTIFEAVGALFHPHHFKVISGTELDRDFNEWQLDKVFVLGDEVSNAGDRRLADKVKRMVTGTSNHINPKHKPAFEQPNLIKYVFLSNHEEILHINDHDRRYYIAKTSDERLPALVADNFYEWKANGGLSHLLHFLMNYDCSSFDPTKPAPMTEAKKEVIDAGRSGLESWVEQIIPSYRDNGQLLVSTSELISEYGQTSDKPVAKALIAAGARKLKKRAMGSNKQRYRLFALGDIERFEAMSETQLGKEWLEQKLSRMGAGLPT